ncbi:hypothetical protein OIO90_005839 [Microbotryomycetes sp. JL221]|nr:hypothetical protein OIO90_005839 [Microbotryomycetes sp. JL221]
MATTQGVLRASSSMTSLGGATTRATLAPKHVSYVLMAEFDIDQGSVLKHQYPEPTGTDEHLLAEHMLPDGVHDRAEDWTVFYLNQIPALTVKRQINGAMPLNGDKDGLGNTSEAIGNNQVHAALGQDESGGLLYVMSLVRTKKDATVRRGALVKALAVVSRHPYIQVFKPVLLLALEDYYKEPSIDCLARVYTAINEMDTSLMPDLSLDERAVLRASDRKDLFEHKFANSSNVEAGGDGSKTTTTTSHTLKSQASASTLGQSAEDAAEVLSPIGERSNSYESLSSMASNSKDLNSSTNSFNEDTMSSKYKSRPGTISSFDDSHFRMPSLSNVSDSRGAGSFSQAGSTSTIKRPRDTHVFDTKAVFRGMTIPIRIPLATFPEDIGEASVSCPVQYPSLALETDSALTFSAPDAVVSGPQHVHLHSNGVATAPIMVLFNALLTHKRVVFLGHQHAAGHVANLVLSACAMASGGGLLPGFASRTFPYTNLSNLDNLEQVPGFIAGVCNPAFADRPSWWDVLCNVETGKITVSKHIEPAPTSSKQLPKLTPSGGVESNIQEDSSNANWRTTAESFDQTFVEEIWSAVQAHYGERTIRARFVDYVQRFIRLASRYEEETLSAPPTIGWPSTTFSNGRLGSGLTFSEEGQALRELQANAGRIEGWTGTPSYVAYRKSQRASTPIQDIDLSHQIARLRHGRRLSVAELELMLRTLAFHAQTSEQVTAILSHLPSHLGGLMPLALSFFHSSPLVRSHTLDLFDKIDSDPLGCKFVQSLNAFQRMAYQRLCRERQQLEASSPKTMESHQTSAPSVPPKDF